MNIKKLALKGNGQPAIPLAYCDLEMIAEQQQKAIKRAEVAAEKAPKPADADLLFIARMLGKKELWHPEFPLGLHAYVCDTDLFLLTARLRVDLPKWNNDSPLDCADFCYLADVLRQLVADSRTVQATLNLSRALAWVITQGQLKGGE